MAQDSKIEWTHHTANLWWGCEHVHDGCDNCYAEAWSKRYAPTGLWGKDTPRMEIKGVWKDLEKYQRLAAAANEMHRVFVGSMMDIGEKPLLVIDRQNQPVLIQPGGRQMTTMDIRWRFFCEVVEACPNLLFLFLSKRPSNYNKIIPPWWLKKPPANVMFGTSIVQRSQLSTLLKQLKQVNGRRFLSLEPQLENIPNIDLSGIDWVIQGGESGPHRRPFDTDWARSMKYQCQVQNVPYFFKQIDKVQPIPDDLQIRQFPHYALSHNI